MSMKRNSYINLICTICFLLFAGAGCRLKPKVKEQVDLNRNQVAYTLCYLPDSSTYILNHNSGIAYDRDQMVVRFFGEAYFKVKASLDRHFVMMFDQFRVECDSAAEFNLNAYDLQSWRGGGHPGTAAENSIRLMVKEGAVTITLGRQPVTVHTGMSIVFGEHGLFDPSYVEGVNDSTWFTGRYYYKIISLKDVAVLARRLYSKDLEFEDGFAGEMFYNFSFDPTASFVAFQQQILRNNKVDMKRVSPNTYKVFSR